MFYDFWKESPVSALELQNSTLEMEILVNASSPNRTINPSMGVFQRTDNYSFLPEFLKNISPPEQQQSSPALLFHLFIIRSD